MLIGLDHTGLGVPDLEAARARFAALGFTLTSREALTRPGPDGMPVVSGADNHVFMMERGYQELIAITDASLGHMLVPRLERYWGLHIVVLASDDVEADRAAFVARGVAATPCATWGREVPGRGAAQFRFFMVAEQDAPEALLAIVQHLTPERLRTPELLNHENGAVALNGCVLHAVDHAAAANRYARILGAAGNGEFRFPDQTFLRIADSDALTTSFPGAAFPVAPSVAAIELAVRRPERVIASGLPIHRDEGGFWLAPQDAFGAVLRFTVA
jgi:catechol 2,3-dioxygenase-like lactoylglutathione lyase family enzyme